MMPENDINPAEQKHLFLIPSFLSETNDAGFIPEYTKKKIHHLKHFVVESSKSARAFLKKMQISTPQQELVVEEWNEHSKPEDLQNIDKLFKQKHDVGLLSDAGLPCVADPGNQVVMLAYRYGYKVTPLPGSSSLFLALMSSGFNGQQFAFNGYLPIDKSQRMKKIKAMENLVLQMNQTQIFMEAPYRNNQLLESILAVCDKQTKLCIACDISSPEEIILTKTIQNWPNYRIDLHKKPVIFILGR